MQQQMSQCDDGAHAAELTRHTHPDSGPNPLLSWTIGQILRELGPKSGFRKRFIETPYLDEVTLGALLDTPFAFHDFMMTCRTLPDCGQTSLTRLRNVVENAAKGKITARQSK